MNFNMLNITISLPCYKLWGYHCEGFRTYSHTVTIPSTPLVNAWRLLGWYETHVTTLPSCAGSWETTFPLTRSHVMNLPSSLPLTTYLSAAPRRDRIRYSVFKWPLNVCRRPPLDLSNNRIVESRVDTRIQLLSYDCHTLVIGSIAVSKI